MLWTRIHGWKPRNICFEIPTRAKTWTASAPRWNRWKPIETRLTRRPVCGRGHWPESRNFSVDGYRPPPVSGPPAHGGRPVAVDAEIPRLGPMSAPTNRAAGQSRLDRLPAVPTRSGGGPSFRARRDFEADIPRFPSVYPSPKHSEGNQSSFRPLVNPFGTMNDEL